MKHTPGPWKVTRFNRPRPYGAAIYHELADDANAAVDIAHMILDGRAPWVMHADACLIEAAPDMLAALQELVAYRDRISGGSRPSLGNHELDARNWERARAAIAKATGGES